jgi:glutamate-ammonia-ligase adenylyltransferase
MRSLIAREKGEDPWDVKLAPGGLTDLEFLAQAVLLSHASRHPTLIGLRTSAVLDEAGRVGLLAPGRRPGARRGARALTDLLHWQRLTVEGRFDPAPCRARSSSGTPPPWLPEPGRAGSAGDGGARARPRNLSRVIGSGDRP